MITKEQIEEAGKFANFCQWFKLELWNAREGNFIPEKSLDEIAMKIFDKFIKIDKSKGHSIDANGNCNMGCC